MNKTQLSKIVADDLGVSDEDGARAVLAVFDAIVRAVAGGEVVNVTNFGTWSPVQCPERAARNPKNGQPVALPARQELRFRRSPRLIELIRDADPDTATIHKLPKSFVS